MNRIKTRNLVIIVLVAAAMIIALPAVFMHETNLANYTLKVYADDSEYTGEEVTPKIKLYRGLIALKEGRDYTVKYKDNVEVGTATATIEGKGRISGEQTYKFDIVKAEQTIEGEDSFKENIADEFDLDQDVDTSLTYESSDEDIATVDEDGTVTPKQPGEITITAKAKETDSYESAIKKITVKITETKTQRVVRKTLEWAREIAADDSYTYGRGQCPKCHDTARRYDCIAFVTAAYWHGGEADFMERWCYNHNHTSVIRNAMINSEDWKSIGNPYAENLQPGDVLFYYKPGRGRNGSGWYHVELYNGDGTVVGAHTFSGKRCISVEPFNDYFRSYCDVYRYVGE